MISSLPTSPSQLKTSLASLFALTLLLLLVPSSNSWGKDGAYLSAGEIAAIGVGSVGAFALGNFAKNHLVSEQPVWARPLPLEAGLTHWIGGEPRPGKRNFLDDDIGSAYTTIAAGCLLGVTDLAWPQGDKSKTFFQDQFLFHSGALATKGVTDLFKGIVRRQRPLVYFAPKIAALHDVTAPEDDFHGFFSGHASSAFFAMTFLNIRARSVMRQEMSAYNYRDWRWLSPTISFGWATFVALSRVQAFRHYISDVAVGAIAGTLIATLFYSFADDYAPPDGATSAPMVIQITISF